MALETLMGATRFENSTSPSQVFLPRYCYATPRKWTVTVVECCCILVWVMNGLWQWCYLTISRWKESCVALETLRGATRFEKSTTITSLSGQILLCHTKMMDCQCFRVLLYVSFSHEWTLAMVLHDYFTLERVVLPLL